MTKDKRDGLSGFMLFLCELTMQYGRGLEGPFLGNLADIYRAGLRNILRPNSL